MKPIIGIVTRPDHLESGRKVDVVYSYVRKAIVEFGGIPLAITPLTKEIYDEKSLDETRKISLEEWNDFVKILDLCDGIVFQGGDCFYDYDLKIVQYAYERNLPSLGICLGMQLMASFRHGIMGVVEDSNLHHTEKREAHEVMLDPNSMLASILGCSSCMVNSRHYESVESTELEIVGRARDGVIEAVEDSKKLFFIGVQWHPEDMIAYNEVMKKLWSNFLYKSKEYANENKRVNQELSWDCYEPRIPNSKEIS